MSVKIHGLWAAGLNVARGEPFSAGAANACSYVSSAESGPAGSDFRARVDLVTNDIVVRD
jgi:hypothetical protein